jgi:hypothetical protein
MRLRYMLVRKAAPGTLPGKWQPLFEDGDLMVLLNTKSTGDAWLLSGAELSPLRMQASGPTTLSIDALTTSSALLLAPANAFPGWSVSIDGQTPTPASVVDGYVAAETRSGQHRYTFSYQPPRAELIVILGLLGWLLPIGLLAWAVSRRADPPI